MNTLHEVGTTELVVEIVGVLPHVQSEKRTQSFYLSILSSTLTLHRIDLVRGAHDLQLVFLWVVDKPRPSASKMRNGCLGEGGLQIGQRTEIAIHCRQQSIRRKLGSSGSHTLPEEGVVPDLSKHRTISITWAA